VKKGAPPQVATMVSVALAQILATSNPDASRSLLVAAQANEQGAPLSAEQTSTLADFTARLEDAVERKKQRVFQQQMLSLMIRMDANVQQPSQAPAQHLPPVLSETAWLRRSAAEDEHVRTGEEHTTGTIGAFQGCSEI